MVSVWQGQISSSFLRFIRKPAAARESIYLDEGASFYESEDDGDGQLVPEGVNTQAELVELDEDLRNWFEQCGQASSGMLLPLVGGDDRGVNISGLSKRWLPPGQTATLFLDYMASRALAGEVPETAAKCPPTLRCVAVALLSSFSVFECSALHIHQIASL